MEALTLLATTLGLSALAGLNLYLTVFVTGFALQQGWLTLAPGLESLQVFNHPLIIVVAGIFYVIEFFADKVPWLDSMWDAVHTAIRPIGAVLLSLAVLGHLQPAAEIMAALLCGSVALGTHLTKAGIRLVANTSPEPFSNIGLSLAEDAFVLGGLFALYTHPLLTFGLLFFWLGLMIWLAPWAFRHLWAHGVYVFGKLNVPSDSQTPTELPRALPEAERILLGKLVGEEERLVWAVPVLAGNFSGWRTNERLHLIRTAQPERVVLLTHRRPDANEAMDPAEVEVSRLSRFFYEELHLFFPQTRRGWVLRFPKNRLAQVIAIQRSLQPAASTPA